MNKVPNDPYYASSNSWGQGYGDLWGVKKINPEVAWNSYTGGLPTIPIAVLDTGLDYNHPELTGLRWTNSREVVNSKDDDGNGLVDDTSGWDFINNDKDAFDDHGHGTHVAGIITAKGNNGTGIVGVNWSSSIIPLKVLDKDGSGSTEAIAQALKYAADIGAKISNNSYGGDGQSQIIDDAIQYEHDKGMVTVVAAGNSNRDAMEFFPASNQNAITVGASDNGDKRAAFSNYGSKIDVAAPGVDILSTKSSVDAYCATQGVNFVLNGNYCRYSGTSMATPYVVGLASLLWARNPTYNNEMIRQMVRAGSTDLGTSGRDDDYGYGRIDISKSLSITPQTNAAPYIMSPKNGAVIAGNSIDIMGTTQKATATSTQVLEYGYGKAPTSWTTIAGTMPSTVTQSKLATLNLTGINDGDLTIRLRQQSNSSLRDEQIFMVHVKIDNIENSITTPFTAVPLNNSVKISGIAKVHSGIGMQKYSLSWGEGASPSSYSSTGITLINNGTQPISNSVLGTWNTLGLKKDAVYTLKLETKSLTGSSESSVVAVRIDGDLKASWPIANDASNNGDLVAADLNGDGKRKLSLGRTCLRKTSEEGLWPIKTALLMPISLTDHRFLVFRLKISLVLATAPM